MGLVSDIDLNLEQLAEGDSSVVSSLDVVGLCDEMFGVEGAFFNSKKEGYWPSSALHV